MEANGCNLKIRNLGSYYAHAEKLTKSAAFISDFHSSISQHVRIMFLMSL